MIVSSYDQIAEWYDESIRNKSLIHDLLLPTLFDLLGNVEGQYLCDLACGQGILARQLARRGARVVGVDISQKLLEIARREEEKEALGIVYLHDDVQTLHTVTDMMFDAVLCNMALMDIADIGAALRGVRRILRPRGKFVCAITHPCFQTPASTWITQEDGTVYRMVRAYFAEKFWRSSNPNGVRGKVGAYHRTMSTYINTLLEAGMILERIVEPQATGYIAANRLWYAEVPAALVMLCRKT